MRSSPSVAALLTVVLGTAGPRAAPPEPAKEPLFEPRVVNVRVEGVSLERVDVSMQIAVKASRNLTVRTLRFSDGLIDTIPVWVAPLEGRWPLRRGEEFVIPPRVQVTAFARDALGAGSLTELLGRETVDARTVVEMSFDTPWLARLFGAATGVAVTEVAFEAPVPAAPAGLQPLARLGAGVLEFLQRRAADEEANRPERRDIIDRFSDRVATVETAYALEGGPAPGARTVRTLGLWWTPSIYCTTREAFEPWRFSAGDASQLQVEGARLRPDATRVRITSGSAAPVELDPRELLRQLPKAADRRVYSLATGEPRRMRLAVRSHTSALLCLRLGPDAGGAVPTGEVIDVSAPLAAFAVDPARGLVWTEAAASAGALTLRTPVHRQSLGSPLVSSTAVVGLVASTDTAWDTRAIAAAAARAVRVVARGTPERAGL